MDNRKLKKRKMNDSNSDEESSAENSTDMIYITYNHIYFYFMFILSSYLFSLI